MKTLQTALFLTLLLGICIFVPSEQTEANCPGQRHSEDSCSSVDTPEPLPLAYTCVDITFNDKKDDRAPIVIVHGFTMFKEAYMHLAQFLALKTARKVCAVDNRNHGDSPWSDETDAKAMASDLALFMKTLDTDKLVVVGHSMGGKIAVEFALTYPEKVEKIVVEDMRPNGMTEEVLEMFRHANMDVVRSFANNIPKGSTEYEAKKAIADSYNKYFESVQCRIKIDENFIDYVPIKWSEDRCTWKSNLEVLDKIWNDPLKFWQDSNGKCDKPALFIHGGISDFKVGDVKEEILELFPNAELHEVKDEGHCLNSHPEYQKEVVDFINSKE